MRVMTKILESRIADVLRQAHTVDVFRGHSRGFFEVGGAHVQ